MLSHFSIVAAVMKIAAARAALGVPPPEPTVIESVAEFMHRVARFEQLRCPHCGGQLCFTATIPPQRYTVHSRGPP